MKINSTKTAVPDIDLSAMAKALIAGEFAGGNKAAKARLNAMTVSELNTLGHHLAEHAGVAELQKFLAAGGNLRAKNRQGFGLAYFAAAAGKVDNLKFLYENGVDVLEVGYWKFSAVHGAALAGSIPCLEFLTGVGADLTKASTIGTPEEVAVSKGHLDAARWIFAKTTGKAKARAA